MKEKKTQDLSTEMKSKGYRKNVFRYIKFFLIPGWRDKIFLSREYEFEKTKSKRRLFRRIINPLSIVGLILIIFVVFCAIYAPWLTIYTLDRVTDGGLSGGTPFEDPTPEHPLGTTKFAYDIFARVIWGCRTAVTFGILAIIIATIGGIVVGTISGYFGRKVDAVIMRLAELIMVFPSLILVILLTQMLGRNLLIILVFFGLLAIPGYARLMRSSVLQVKQDLYIEAAKAGGAGNFKVMFKHIFANAISPVIIRFFGGAGLAVLAFAGIAFLGFGDQGIPDWGTDINWGRDHVSALNATLWPGFFIMITVVGFMLFGDGLRDALDPRLQLKNK